jgi:hypothetical protein
VCWRGLLDQRDCGGLAPKMAQAQPTFVNVISLFPWCFNFWVFFFFGGFWGSFYCLASVIFCFVFGFKLIAFKILIYSAYEFDLMVFGFFWCALFLGPFCFHMYWLFTPITIVSMVVVTYCGGRYLVREIGYLGYRKMLDLFKCLTPQIMGRC